MNAGASVKVVTYGSFRVKQTLTIFTYKESSKIKIIDIIIVKEIQKRVIKVMYVFRRMLLQSLSVDVLMQLLKGENNTRGMSIHFLIRSFLKTTPYPLTHKILMKRIRLLS